MGRLGLGIGLVRPSAFALPGGDGSHWALQLGKRKVACEFAHFTLRVFALILRFLSLNVFAT